MKLKFTKESMLVGTLLPPTWYPMEVKRVEKTHDKDNADLEIVHFAISDGDMAGVPLRYNISEKGDPGFHRHLFQALGARIAEGITIDTTDIEVGKTLLGYVERGSYNNKPTNNLVDFKPMGR